MRREDTHAPAKMVTLATVRPVRVKVRLQLAACYYLTGVGGRCKNSSRMRFQGQFKSFDQLYVYTHKYMYTYPHLITHTDVHMLCFHKISLSVCQAYVSVSVSEDDDCLPGNNDCSENAVCVNTRESYECNCTEGYRNKDARTCEGEASNHVSSCGAGNSNKIYHYLFLQVISFFTRMFL